MRQHKQFNFRKKFWWRRCVTVVFGAMLIFAGRLSAQETEALIDVNIGVLAHRGDDMAIAMWRPTAEYLSTQVPGFHFSIKPLTNDNIRNAVENKDVHFVLSNPAIYARLEATQGISRIATLMNQQFGGPQTRFGAVIFTSESNNDIFSLRDLVGKTFMAVHPNAFGGWWMALREFRRSGINPDTDFRAVKFNGFPQDEIVYAVRRGEVSAGTVRSGILERMAAEGKISIHEFRVLNPKLSPDFSLSHSTELYPEWAFATTRHTNRDLAQHVAVALLSMPRNSKVALAANSAGWTVPLDYQPVHDLMRELGVAHYQTDQHGRMAGLSDSQTLHLMIAMGALAIILIFGLFFYLCRQKQKNALINSLESNVMEMNKQLDLAKIFGTRLMQVMDVMCDGTQGSNKNINELLLLGRKMFGMDLAEICEVNEVAKTYYIIYEDKSDDISPTKKQLRELNNSLCELTYNCEGVIIIHDVQASELRNHASSSSQTVKSFLGAPVYVYGRKIGALCFYSVQDTHPSANNDESLLLHMALAVGHILETEVLEQKLAATALTA